MRELVEDIAYCSDCLAIIHLPLTKLGSAANDYVKPVSINRAAQNTGPEGREMK